MRLKKGFTLIELLVVIAIIALLVSILVPTLGRARELARQAACMANLSAIGKSIVMYAGTTSDQYPFPLLTNVGDPNVAVSASTHANTDLFTGTTNTTLGTNGMQNVWILIQQNLVGQAAFHCPSDGGWNNRTDTTDKFGWTALTQFSYGVQWPYDSKTAAGTANPAKLSDSNAQAGLIIFADRNPFKTGSLALSSSVTPANHSQDGEAVLKKDSSVSFYKNTINTKAGYSGDDIYLNGASALDMPVDNTSTTPAVSGMYDSFITPAPSR